MLRQILQARSHAHRHEHSDSGGGRERIKGEGTYAHERSVCESAHERADKSAHAHGEGGGEPGHEHFEGLLIDRVRMYEIVSNVGFLGRRGRVYRRIVKLSGARPGDLVLDVGCNGGYLARLFAAAVAPGGRVTGIDPSEPAIAYARRKAPVGCEFVVGVAQELGLPDQSFDVVASTLAVHHIPEASRATAFSEMYRVLRPGGTLLVADFRPSGRGPHAVASGMRHINPDLLDGLATDAGFHIEGRGDLPMLRYIRAVRPVDPAAQGGAGGGLTLSRPRAD